MVEAVEIEIGEELAGQVADRQAAAAAKLAIRPNRSSCRFGMGQCGSRRHGPARGGTA